MGRATGRSKTDRPGVSLWPSWPTAARGQGLPPPLGRSAASDVLLYHLPTDHGERHALDVGKHEAIVARLRALTVQYEATKVPQLTGDPACPAFAPLASTEGRWIGPWCDGV